MNPHAFQRLEAPSVHRLHEVTFTARLIPSTGLANGMHWWPNPLLDEDEVPAWSWLVGPVSETPQ